MIEQAMCCLIAARHEAQNIQNFPLLVVQMFFYLEHNRFTKAAQEQREGWGCTWSGEELLDVKPLFSYAGGASVFSVLNTIALARREVIHHNGGEHVLI